MRFLFNIIRSAVVIFSVICFGFFVAPMFGGMINIGNLTGAVLSVWLFCVGFKPLHRAVKNKMKKHKFSKFLYRFVNLCFVLFTVYGAIATSAIAYCSLQTPAENSTAIVLGAQVKPWGPSIILQGRIDAAERYLSDNPDAKAVLTGGKGDDEPISEAQSMFDTMTAYGIETNRLFMENKATNTEENLKYSMEIVKENNLSGNIAIVTDGFHQLRARIIAYKLGIKENVGAVNADTSVLYIPTYVVREWFAIPNEILLR